MCRNYWAGKVLTKEKETTYVFLCDKCNTSFAGITFEDICPNCPRECSAIETMIIEYD